MNDVPSYHALIRFCDFELDTESRELLKQGVKVRLQEQPFQILHVLLEQPGKVVTREELQRRIWPSDTFVDFDRGINFCINQIRAALGDDADRPRYIETLPRRGYRFIANIDSNGKMEPGDSASLILETPPPSRDNESEKEQIPHERYRQVARAGKPMPA